jgi:hypothetical protein
MSQSFVPEDPERFAAALRRFDEENSRDPNVQLINGKSVPRELAYSEWLSAWVLRLKPQASEALRLAARSAHLCRWAIGRDTYPSNRAGYLRWREALKQFHAQKVAAILAQAGYSQTVIAHVQGLVSKRAFPSDPESRVLEDALCLVFLEHQLADLAEKNPADKVVNALQKSWKKMTPMAQEIARGLSFEPRERALLDRALSANQH